MVILGKHMGINGSPEIIIDCPILTRYCNMTLSQQKLKKVQTCFNLSILPLRACQGLLNVGTGAIFKVVLSAISF